MQTNGAIQVREQPTGLVPFEPHGLNEALTLADALSKSNLVPSAVRGKPSDILVILLTARELGIGPMQGLSDINVIQGKPVYSADLMVAQCKRRADVCKYIRLVETTDQRAIYETLRVGSPEPERFTFTIDDARRLGIADKDNYKKQPKTMLRRRAAAALAREVYPDLVRGYDPDEAEDFRPRNVVAPPPPPEQPHVEIDPAAVEVLTQSELADAPAPSDDPLAEFRVALAAATDRPALNKLIKAINAMPEEQKVQARALYTERAKEIK